MWPERLQEVLGRHFVMLLVRLVGLKRYRAFFRFLDESLDSSPMRFLIKPLAFFTVEPLPKQITNAGPDDKIGHETSFDNVDGSGNESFARHRSILRVIASECVR